MPTSAYMQRRMQYLKSGTRPQAMLFADNPGTLSNGSYIPNGTEWEDFIIVSDHNRSPISMAQQRVETRQRMVNANMRSYWIADKLQISTSWQRLPSRGFSKDVEFDSNGDIVTTNYTAYTVDYAAGGVDLLSWYETHQGPFWLYLAYDKFRVLGTTNYNRLAKYNQVLQVYFSSFDYTIEKRGGTLASNMWNDNSTPGFDLWNVNISLEEV